MNLLKLFTETSLPSSPNFSSFVSVSSNDSPSIQRSKGLSNNLGENNCFLNVIIQALWHLLPFKNKFMEIEYHQHIASSDSSNLCVFCSLKSIFVEYGFGQEKVIPPNSLRSAMAALFYSKSKFQLGEFDDAGEAFTALLHCLHQTLRPQNAENSFISDLFGLTIIEQITCKACSETSEPSLTTNYIFYISSESLLSVFEKFKVYQMSSSFSELLRGILSNFTRKCPNEKCNYTCGVNYFCTTYPSVFTVGIAWDTENAEKVIIEKILNLIDEKLDLNLLFPSQNGPILYSLRGIVSYYRHHYNASLLQATTKIWWVFDDATALEISSSFQKVKERILKGRYQPSILFFEKISNSSIEYEAFQSQTNEALINFEEFSSPSNNYYPSQPNSFSSQVNTSTKSSSFIDTRTTQSDFPSNASTRSSKSNDFLDNSNNRLFQSDTSYSSTPKSYFPKGNNATYLPHSNSYSSQENISKPFPHSSQSSIYSQRSQESSQQNTSSNKLTNASYRSSAFGPPRFSYQSPPSYQIPKNTSSNKLTNASYRSSAFGSPRSSCQSPPSYHQIPKILQNEPTYYRPLTISNPSMLDSGKQKQPTQFLDEDTYKEIQNNK